MKIAYLFASSLLLFACGDDDDDTADTTPQIDGDTPQIDGDTPQIDGDVPEIDAGPPAEFALTSTAVTKGELLDDTYRCVPNGGDNLSPPLAWTAGPAGTLSYAIIFRDLNNGLTHSTIFDIPAATLALPEDVSKVFEPEEVPGAKQSLGYSEAQYGYHGPCPGSVHTYEFTIYAIDVATLPGLDEDSLTDAVEAAVEAHDLASAKLELQSE